MSSAAYEAVNIFHKIIFLFALIDDSMRRLQELLLRQKAGEINDLSVGIIHAVGSITSASREYLPEYADEKMVCLEDEFYSELQSFKYAINILSYDYALYSLEKSLQPSFARWRQAVEQSIGRYTAA